MLLTALGDFQKAWRLLLEHIEKLSLSTTQEVSLAALKSFHEMVMSGEEKGEPDQARWATAWKSWLSIGSRATVVDFEMLKTSDSPSVPSQAFLTSLAHIFPLLFPHIKMTFTVRDLENLSSVVMSLINIPVLTDSELGYILSGNDDSLLPLHISIYKCISVLESHALSSNQSLLPGIFRLYEKLSCLVHSWPQGADLCQVKGLYPGKFVLFGEKMLISLGRLYEKTHNLKVVDESCVLLDIMNTVRIPLKNKYSCAKQSTWRIAKEVLLSVISTSLSDSKVSNGDTSKTALTKDAAKDGEVMKDAEVWSVVSEALDSFLFPEAKPPQDRSADELCEDELIDCDIIEFLKDKVLSQPFLFPQQFLLSIMVILNKGSIHSASQSSFNSDLNQNLDLYLTIREDFARICFETLLQFSLLEDSEQINGNDEYSGLLSKGEIILKGEDEKMTNKLAVTSLLYRFKEVLKKYVSDEALHAPVPLPAHRVSEMSFVLKAIATLISSLKKSAGDVDRRTWVQLIDLYPELVSATASTAPSVAASLKQALLQYRDLLHPPPAL